MRNMTIRSLVNLLVSSAVLGLTANVMANEKGQSDSATSANSSTAKSQADQKSKDSPQEADASVVLLVPVELASSDQTNQGCWARVYDRENYRGDMLTLVGPVTLADMDGPFGLNWDDRVNSIQVGPKATVTVYDDPLWQDRVAQFKSGQKHPELSERLGFFDEFGSVNITCNKA